MSNAVKDAKARAKGERAYAKASRPWYKKKRYVVAVLIALLILISVAVDSDDEAGVSSAAGSGAGQGEAPEKEAPEEEAPEEEAIDVTAQQLIEDLESNALAASREYKDKRVVLTGNVSTIDSSGNYFAVTGTDDFSLQSVQIYIDENMTDTVAGFSEGQEVSVTGKVTDVGEVLGYSIDADSIK